jgi:OmpA-OmpF porin, OOP family
MEATMKLTKSLSLLVVLSFLIAPCFLPAKENEDLKNTLFSDLKNMIEKARMEKADILSPVNFSEGEKAYKQAMDSFNAGKSLEAIKKSLETATGYIKKATDNIELSKLTLGKLLAAREDAINASATKYALDDFKSADGFFADAAKQVESGNVTKARKLAEKAEPIFRKAEAKAIKEGLLGDVKNLARTAQEKDAKANAPKTLKSAEKKLADAEAFIDSKDYNIEIAKKKVEESRYEYEHSLRITENVNSAKKGKLSMEEIYLNNENNLGEISKSLGIASDFDKGGDYQLKSIVAAIDRNNKDREDLNQRLSKSNIEYENKLSDLNKQITDKDKEIASLKGKTETEAEKLNTLKQKLEKDNQAKERYETIRGLFAAKEGQVLKDGNDIVLQLYGLTFPSGKSTVEVENYDLLAKVQKSIREFPGARVVVEGHTDSLGDKKQNEILSEDRAKAIMKYLVSNNAVEESKISSIGFGDTRPFASNKSPDGRAKNRRISIIIKSEQPTP